MGTKSYSSVYRILHWAIALSFMLILFTIFLRLTWMNKFNVAEIIGDFLKNTNQELSQDELIVLAKKIRQPMWNWHIYFGYVLTGLFFIRFTIPFFGLMKFQNPTEKKITGKEKFQKWTYIIFYVCVVISLITGLIIDFGPKVYKKDMEAIHIQSLYYLIPFIILHI